MNIERAVKVVALLLMLPGAASGEYPDAVQMLIEDGLNVEARFEAPGGLDGFVARKNGRPVTLYLMPDGEHVIVGDMVDGFGQNLSAEHVRHWLPETDLENAWTQLENATWVAEGAAEPKRVVYVFSDPNCGYCVAFRKKARPFLDRAIQLRHIMVGVIQPSSLAKAASVISGEDPVERLDFHDSEFPENWIDSPGNVPDELRRKIEENNRLMKALGVSATPSVFYRDEEGDVRKIVGLPDDSALSESVFRAPYQGS